MLETQAPKTTRDIVRETLTPSRVGILSWAFAAVFMGTIGLASYQFASRPFAPFPDSRTLPSGIPLAAGSTVETTASINRGTPVAIATVPSPLSGTEGGQNLQQSQIEVLQQEVVGLRRRLTGLTEQNLIYSSRIAALEQEVALAKLALSARTKTLDAPPVAPQPGKIVMNDPDAGSAGKPAPGEAMAKPQIGTQTEAAGTGTPAQQEIEPTAKKTEFRLQPANIGELPPPKTMPAPENGDPDPVRIVSPTPGDTSTITTASIPDTTATDPQTFDSTPTRTGLAPRIISPSAPSGQIRGTGSDGQIRRSDFGAVIGHYRSRAGAAKAWADFKEQNEERMRDLRPLLMERQTDEGGIALMIGPFANAADASVACVHLLDVTELCRPALYAGDPLVTAAEFRDNAFSPQQ
ncbi:MAG: hypothetical protein RDA78_21170 [Roseibium sp.]|uniref:hypothetical protein n=1 Tax=Roseibium sp. TaxID=1936156 RepID=UPI003D9C5A70